LSNYYTILKPEDKLNHLVQFLKDHSQDKAIVFFLTCACVDYFTEVFRNLECMKHLSLFPLHGRMNTKLRTKKFKTFATLEAGVLLCTDVVARGIDIPDVDWILQFDAPQDPSFFIHRVGRTARMGRKGEALIYLMPREEAYIDFLKAKNVPFRAYESEGPEPEDVLPLVKKMALEDREMMEKGQAAIVSYLRGYREHYCSLIFVFNLLPFAQLAQGFGLLYFPRLPDMKHFSVDYKRNRCITDGNKIQRPGKREKTPCKRHEKASKK